MVRVAEDASISMPTPVSSPVRLRQTCIISQASGAAQPHRRALCIQPNLSAPSPLVSTFSETKRNNGQASVVSWLAVASLFVGARKTAAPYVWQTGYRSVRGVNRHARGHPSVDGVAGSCQCCTIAFPCVCARRKKHPSYHGGRVERQR